jgi:phage shock protein A
MPISEQTKTILVREISNLEIEKAQLQKQIDEAQAKVDALNVKMTSLDSRIDNFRTDVAL